MQKLIIFSACLAIASAAPAFVLSHDAEIHVPLGKTTITKSSQVVDHGSTFVHAVPVVHATPVVHAEQVFHATPVVHSTHLVHASPIYHIHPSKTTVTKSSQTVNHGSTLHSIPLVHQSYHVPHKTTFTNSNHVVDHGSTHLIHSVPVVHTPVLVHSSPVVTFKGGDSAVSHHSSTVHETVPVVKSVSLVSYHH